MKRLKNAEHALHFREPKHGDELLVDAQPRGGALIQIGMKHRPDFEPDWYSIRVSPASVDAIARLLAKAKGVRRRPRPGRQAGSGSEGAERLS